MIRPETQDSDHLRLVDYLFRVKSVLGVMLLFLFVMFRLMQFLNLETNTLIAVLLFEIFISFLYFPLRTQKPEWASRYVAFSLYADVLAVTIGLHYVGGIYSMMWSALYLLFVATAGFFLSEPGRWVYVAYVSIVYSLLCYLEHEGIVARQNVLHLPVSHQLDLFSWLSTMSLILFTFFLSNRFMERIGRLQRLADLGRISTEIAHEIRTPLQIIGGLAEGEGDRGSSGKEIKTQIERIAHFVKEIIALGREEITQPSRVGIRAIVDHAIDRVLETSDPRKEVVVERDFCEEELLVQVDIDQTTQAFSNLARHSVDAIPRKGKIRVHIARNGFEWVQVVIQDTGPGILQGEHEKIFEPFHTSKTGRRGVGLGLAVAKRFIESNGGTIEVESEVGKGNQFTVNLPVIPSEGGRNDLRQSPGGEIEYPGRRG
jgi:signal transduction histidine kinase